MVVGRCHNRGMAGLHSSRSSCTDPRAADRNRPVENPKLKWREAQAAGENLMASYAKKEGFRVIRPTGLNYFEMSGLYNYIVETDRRFPYDREATVVFDANTGDFHQTMRTFNDNPRITVNSWLLTAADLAVLQKFFGDPLNRVAGDRKTNPLSESDNGGVDADHATS
jgi:hypothetical protein